MRYCPFLLTLVLLFNISCDSSDPDEVDSIDPAGSYFPLVEDITWTYDYFRADKYVYTESTDFDTTRGTLTWRVDSYSFFRDTVFTIEEVFSGQTHQHFVFRDTTRDPQTKNTPLSWSEKIHGKIVNGIVHFPGYYFPFDVSMCRQYQNFCFYWQKTNSSDSTHLAWSDAGNGTSSHFNLTAVRSIGIISFSRTDFSPRYPITDRTLSLKLVRHQKP